MTRSPRAQTGFGLLEALVALTLFSLTGVVLFGWINLSLTTLARAETQLQRAQRSEIALAALQALDLFEQRDGHLEPAPDWQLRWEAEPLTLRQTTAPLPGGSQGGHEVQLFRLRAWLEPEDTDTEQPSLECLRLMYR